MCEETCLVCEQCDKFLNGCQGQRGTFFRRLCPSVIIDTMETQFTETKIPEVVVR